MKISSKTFEAPLTLYAAFLVCISQFYNLFSIRAFWLDEWITVFEMKIRGKSLLFHTLRGFEFPRGLLVLMKIFASLGNFSNFSLRLVPALTAVAIVWLTILLARRMFSQTGARLLFIVSIFCNKYTVHYLPQVRHYSTQILWAMIAVFIYDQLFVRLQNHGENYKKAIIFFSFLIGPFFSYSFSVVLIPIICLLAAQCVVQRPTFERLGYISAFATSFGSIYVFILTKSLYPGNYITGAYQASMFDISNPTEGVRLLYDFFSYSLFVPEIAFGRFAQIFIQIGKLAVSLLVCTGIVSGCFSLLRIRTLLRLEPTPSPQSGELKHQAEKFDTYFSLLGLLALALFFMGKIPLGFSRMAYYLLPMLCYFFVKGVYISHYFLGKISRSFKVVTLTGMAGFVLYGFVFMTTKYLNEFSHKNVWFNQAIYDSVGEALYKANLEFEKPTVFISRGFGATFLRYGGFGLENIENMIQTHPNFLTQYPIELLRLSDEELCNGPEGSHMGKVILDAQGRLTDPITFCLFFSNRCLT